MKTIHRISSLSAIFAVVGLTGVHIFVVSQGPGYSGFLLVMDHFFEIVLAIALLALSAGVGSRILSLCRCVFDSALESLLFSLGVGCGIIATAILALGFFNGLHAVTLTALLLFFAVVARNDVLGLVGLIARTTVEIKIQGNVLTFLVFGFVALFMISQALLPTSDWDSLVYHLRVPTQFLEAGRIYLPEDNLHVAFVQLAHMLYIPLLAYGSPAGPALLSSFFALLLGLGAFALSRRFFAAPTATFTLALIWANTMIILVAITPRVDVTLAYYLLLAHFALLASPSNWMFFYLSAATLGLAGGVKYHAIAYGLALSPLIVWVAYRKQAYIRQTLSSICAYGILATVGVLPWLIKNWWLFGAPLYPFFSRREVDPWLTFLYPERIQPVIINVYSELRQPFNLFDLFFNPIALTVETEAIFYHISPLVICLLLWLLYYLKNRNANGLMLPALAYFAVAIVFSSKTNLRYLTPVLAPFSIVATYVTLERLILYLGRRMGLIFFYVISLATLWPTIGMLSFWILRPTPLLYLTGGISREGYVTNNSGFGPALTYVNQNLSPEDRVLMLFEARGFYFRVPVIQDNLFSNWMLLARRSSSLNCLQGSGISHVFVNESTVDFFIRRGLDPRVLELDDFHRFAEQCLTPVHESNKYIVYRVNN